MRKETLMAPVGPAASSSAWETVSPTSRVSCSDSGDWARQRRTKSRMSGIEDGRAGNVCDTTTTGTTSMLWLIWLFVLSMGPFLDLRRCRQLSQFVKAYVPGAEKCDLLADGQKCPAFRRLCLVPGAGQVYADGTEDGRRPERASGRGPIRRAARHDAGVTGRAGTTHTHSLDEWRSRLRRGLGGADGCHPAQHRGDRARRPARAAEGGGALAADRLRVRPRARGGHVHRMVAQGRPGR